ncbi:MAG: DUF1579 domain-containing protein [Calditrichaeota bacterium]|nr:MAG: DUF1579 domain-containing protein [Calditrichota bacterium]
MAKKLLFLFLVLPLAVVTGQTNQKPCTSEESRQFDFWLGTWDLAWPGGQMGIPEGQTGTGTNQIKKVLGTCVIEENFSFPGGKFDGRSLSVFNPQKKMWQQTWVDNSGAYLLFEGQVEDGKMVLQMEPVERNGKTFISRMVFENITENALDWNWQRSSDGGKTWKDLWNIHYTRRAK